MELEGSLLLVQRLIPKTKCGYYSTWAQETHKFDVYSLDWDRKQWIEVKIIGKKAILLGKHSSISVDVFDAADLKANCI